MIYSNKLVKFVLLCLLIGGCIIIPQEGTDPQGYKWRKDGSVGIPVIHKDTDVYLYCGLEEKAKSCAIVRDGVCDVYLPPDPEAWQEPHELKHCDGWRHPDQNWIHR